MSAVGTAMRCDAAQLLATQHVGWLAMSIKAVGGSRGGGGGADPKLKRLPCLQLHLQPPTRRALRRLAWCRLCRRLPAPRRSRPVPAAPPRPPLAPLARRPAQRLPAVFAGALLPVAASSRCSAPAGCAVAFAGACCCWQPAATGVTVGTGRQLLAVWVGTDQRLAAPAAIARPMAAGPSAWRAWTHPTTMRMRACCRWRTQRGPAAGTAA